LGEIVDGGEVAAKLANIKGPSNVSEAWQRTAEHLKENKVESYKIAVGPSLELDSVAETFKGNEKANTMLTREYRKGYEIPSASGI
jgi:uncharacterized protein YaaN involved in tellurite resistance